MEGGGRVVGGWWEVGRREILIPLYRLQWNTEYPLQQDGRPVAPAYALEKAQIPCLIWTGGLTPL